MLVVDGRGRRCGLPLISFSLGTEYLSLPRPLAPNCTGSLGQGDGAELPPVVGFAAMRRTAEAVETVGVDVCVEAYGFDCAESYLPQTILDVGGKIKVRLVFADEEARACRIRSEETLPKRFVDFVRR